MNDTTFTIERYYKLVVEEKTHSVELLTSHLPIRIICTDRIGPHQVVGLVRVPDEIHETVQLFSANAEGVVFGLRIVPISPKSLGWVGVYRHENGYGPSRLHPTREALLERWSECNLIAIHEFFEGDGI